MRIDAIQYLKEVIEFLTDYKKELEAIEKYNNRLWDKIVGEFQRGRGNPADIYLIRNKLQFRKPHLPIEKEKEYDRLAEEIIVGLEKLGDGRLQEKSSEENIREAKTH